MLQTTLLNHFRSKKSAISSTIVKSNKSIDDDKPKCIKDIKTLSTKESSDVINVEATHGQLTPEHIVQELTQSKSRKRSRSTFKGISPSNARKSLKVTNDSKIPEEFAVVNINLKHPNDKVDHDNQISKSNSAQKSESDIKLSSFTINQISKDINALAPVQSANQVDSTIHLEKDNDINKIGMESKKLMIENGSVNINMSPESQKPESNIMFIKEKMPEILCQVDLKSKEINNKKINAPAPTLSKQTLDILHLLKNKQKSNQDMSNANSSNQASTKIGSNTLIKEHNEPIFSSNKMVIEDTKSNIISENNSSNPNTKTQSNTETRANSKSPVPVLSQQTLDIINTIKLRKNAMASNFNNNIEQYCSPSPKDVSDTIRNITLKSPMRIDQLRSPGQAMKSPIPMLKSPFSLKGPQDTRSPSRIEEILKSPSIKDKWGELLKSEEERNFILPYEYQELLNVFSQLDHALNYFLAKEISPFLNDILNSLEKTLRKRITMAHIGQILHVYPNGYCLRWEKNEKHQNDYELYLTYPSEDSSQNIDSSKKIQHQTKLDQRKIFFKQRLLEITRQHHERFLQTLTEQEREIDYEAIRCWNSKFEVHKVPSIPEAKLPVKPTIEKSQSIEEFLKASQTIKNKVLKDIMESTAQKYSQPEIKSNIDVRPKVGNLGISQKLLDIVKAKEQAIAEQEQLKQLERSKKNIHKKDELLRLAEMLRVYYIQRNVSHMFLVNVIEHSSNATNSIFLGKGEVHEYINILIKINPNWLNIIDNPNGKILKMDKTIPMSIIQSSIESSNLSL